MRQGISDEFLRVIFKYSSRAKVSLSIKTVLRSLTTTFIPHFIGFNSITREDYIVAHVPDFANELYNPNPEGERPVIAVIDASYSYIYKSTNFCELRQIFSMHKHSHLVKPIMIVAPDGFILDVHGPYFFNARNNDASILIDQMEIDYPEMRNWFQENDILSLDRGYRDALPYLQELDLNCKMPPFLPPGQRQFTTEEANDARIITKSRWIIESRNGHFQSVFKFFNHVIEKAHIADLNGYYKIAGALINRFHPLITMNDATIDIAD